MIALPTNWKGLGCLWFFDDDKYRHSGAKSDDRKHEEDSDDDVFHDTTPLLNERTIANASKDPSVGQDALA